ASKTAPRFFTVDDSVMPHFSELLRPPSWGRTVNTAPSKPMNLRRLSANDPTRTSIALEEGVRNYWVASVSLRVTSAIEASCQGSSTLLNAPVPDAPAYAPVPDKTLYSPVKPLPFQPPV